MSTAQAVADHEQDLHRLLADVALLSCSDKLVISGALKQAVSALAGGFVAVAMAAAERAASSIADEAMQRAAASARSSSVGERLDEAQREPPLAGGAQGSGDRRFRPEIREGQWSDSASAVIRIADVVSSATLREILAEMLTYGERGVRHDRLLIDFSAACFALGPEDWIDFSRAWLAVQPTHLGLGYVVPPGAAYEVIDALAWAGVRRGRVNLLWQRREDAADWLGY